MVQLVCVVMALGHLLVGFIGRKTKDPEAPMYTLIGHIWLASMVIVGEFK